MSFSTSKELDILHAVGRDIMMAEGNQTTFESVTPRSKFRLHGPRAGSVARHGIVSASRRETKFRCYSQNSQNEEQGTDIDLDQFGLRHEKTEYPYGKAQENRYEPAAGHF